MQKKTIDKTNRILLVINFIVLSSILAFLIYSFMIAENITLPFFPTNVEEVSSLADLSIVGYDKFSVEVGVSDDTGVITLTSGCYQIVATTEYYQAESIANGLAGRIGARPNSHDTIASVFKNLGIKVLTVKITELRNSTFISTMILQQGNNILSVDSRPSDAIAIGVRMKTDEFYIKDDLLKEQGRNICS